MATYAELFELLSFQVAGSNQLFDKVGVATLISADKIKTGNDDASPFDQAAGMHEKRLRWAARVFAQPRGIAQDIYTAVIAGNASATQSQILSATDASIQAAVDTVVDIFANALTPGA